MQILENYSLRQHNTFGIEATASHFAALDRKEDLLDVLEYRHKLNEEIFILGGGSNILLLDNLRKFVVKNEIGGIEVLHEDGHEVIVRVGAGTVWHQFVMHAVSRGWGGVENLSLIPGTVGASPIQNIGAYGVEIKDVFVELEAVNLENGTTTIFDHQSCAFGYRYSVFKAAEKDKWIITSVTFRLGKSREVNTSYGDIRKILGEMGITRPGIADVSRAVVQIRSSKLPDPAVLGNAGSFFKNPEIEADLYHELQQEFEGIPGYPVDGSLIKVPAGWLIEKAGWKGYRDGNVGVHERQALVLVNYGGATGLEISNLAERIQQSVEEKFRIRLAPEVNFIR